MMQITIRIVIWAFVNIIEGVINLIKVIFTI